MELRDESRGHQVRDLLRRKSQIFGEDLEALSADERRREARTTLVAPNPELVPGIGDLAHFWVIEPAVETAMCVLRIFLEVTAALHVAGGNSGFDQFRHGCAGWLRL